MARIEGLWWHGLRATFCTRLALAGSEALTVVITARRVCVTLSQLFQSVSNLFRSAWNICIRDCGLSQVSIDRHQDVNPTLDPRVRDARTCIPQHLHELLNRKLIPVEHLCTVFASNVVAVRLQGTWVKRRAFLWLLSVSQCPYGSSRSE